MDDPYLYILLVILICLSAFFSATETAFSSVSKMRLKHYASTGDKRAEKALSIIDRFDDALSAILIGNNIVNIASASIGTVIFTDLIGGKWGPGVSTLVMTVTEKQADIAILRTLGASPRSIMKIFMIQGALAGIFGTLIGTGFGILVAVNIDVIMPFIERLFGFQLLPKDIYLISSLPSDLQWKDVLLIGGSSIVLSFLATLYPSWSAAKVNPAEALRYE